MPFPCPQAVSSPTFVVPPIDGSLTIPQIYDHHMHNSPSHPLFVYDADDAVKTITWKQAGQAIHSVARRLGSVPSLQNAKDTPVVGIFAVTDQLSYFAITGGIMRAGFRAFPISPRNSEQGVANLLQKMNVTHLIVSHDDATRRTAKAACQAINNSLDVTLLDVPKFTDLYSDQPENFTPLPPLPATDVSNLALILHSSGSTSFPKPILLTHRHLLQWGSQPFYGETDLCGRILSNHSLPFFHAMGVVSLAWATMTGVTLSNFAPKEPPAVATAENLFQSAVACHARLIFCVPTFLEEWSQDPNKLLELQKFEAIMFGGAPIQQAVGDLLTEMNIHLYPFYGATELGGVSTFLPKTPPPEGWQYFKISSHAQAVFLNHGDEDNVYQLLIKTSTTHTPAVTNTSCDGVNSYDTNDLVIRHPTNPELMRIYGRADDQIMHSTGEKTNPVPMETIINRHPMVQSSVIFGRGRFQAGVLVEPKQKYSFDPNDKDKLKSFRNAIWSSVEEANNFGPSHSRIFKEIILVANPSKPFLYTPKGTPRRQVVINLYEQEIEQGYTDLENASIDLGNPESFGPEECRSFVSQLVEQIVGRKVQDDEDFFLCGCDSLKATWIRNNILNGLRTLNADVEGVPVNFIYLYPTISRLSQYLNGVVSGQQADPIQETMQRMNELVEKYSTGFVQHKPTVETKPETETILLTGSTGGLGSYILAHLIQDNAVSKIYCMNRKGRISSSERQKSAFEIRGIDMELLNSEKVVFLEGESSLPNLGLSGEQYDEVRSEITSVLHVAWRVDFNISISSTEPLIAGTKALANLCLSSPRKEPPRLVFASSIGAVRNWVDGDVPERSLPDAKWAVGSGYPESKWVAEQVLNNAATENPAFRPVVVRIGQLTGAENGFWSPSEWVPSVIRSAPALQCLPDTPGRVSWIPVHFGGEVFAKLRSSPFPFVHLVHPHSPTWTELFRLISNALKVPLVPYNTWLGALEKSAQTSNTKVPSSSLALLDYYQSAKKPLHSENDDAFGFPRLSTKLSETAVPALSSFEKLGLDDVTSWLTYWSTAGDL